MLALKARPLGHISSNKVTSPKPSEIASSSVSRVFKCLTLGDTFLLQTITNSKT